MDSEGFDPDKMIWSYLIHLGYNMWEDRDASEQAPDKARRFYKPYLRCDKPVWDEVLQRLADAGANQVIIDLGEGVVYGTHPELAVEGSWTVEKLRDELGVIREMGLEPIPKLNFSATHDAWLGPYARCLSTETYYKVCSDLISEVIDIFEKPRFFHLGMDEETANSQRYHAIEIVRQYDLWWHDLNFYVNEVEKAGVRPWVWSDYLWNHPALFFKNMPKSVMQSNWYYRMEFDPEENKAGAFLELDKRGYDQVPTGSTHGHDDNLPRLVEFCLEHISPERLYGFMQTPWRSTLPEFKDAHVRSVDALERAKRIVG